MVFEAKKHGKSRRTWPRMAVNGPESGDSELFSSGPPGDLDPPVEPLQQRGHGGFHLALASSELLEGGLDLLEILELLERTRGSEKEPL